MEFVAWDAQSGNAENSNDLAVNGTQGYIGTGYASDTGLTHPVYHHLPLHPPVGLMDLQPQPGSVAVFAPALIIRPI